MRVLLDTHIFLWCIKGDRRLTKSMRTKISQATEVYVSSASIWEVVIKMKLNKLEADIDQVVAAIADSGFMELSITASHAVGVSRLPDIHRDPFDRILIAQAMCEPLTLLTADSTLRRYSELVEVLGK
jgi:PIN domain nuclease of toxin-antitoxin system